MTDKQHPLTDEMIQGIWDKVGNDIVDAKDEDLDGFVEDALMRAAYDIGYAQALEGVQNAITRVLRYKRKDSPYAESLEDVQDAITSIQRKDSPSTPITLEELKDL